MSFGAEFRNMRNQGGSPKVTPEVDKEAEVKALEKDSQLQAVEDPDAETFSQPFQHGDALVDTPEAEAPPVIPPPKPDSKKIAIKIGGKTFDNEQDALNYANELEYTRIQEEAYKQGQESAKPKENKPVEPKKIKKIADKLFENPDEAMEDLEALVDEKVNQIIEARENKKTTAQLAADKMKEDTDNFYKNNADLADWQDEVNLVVNKNWASLSKLPKDQVIVETAKLAREYVASVKERALPRQALPSKAAITPNGGQSTTATQKPATEKKVSFASQVRSTNKRTVLQDEA